MSEHAVSCEMLTTGYSGVPVVRDLSLHVDFGEVVALLGANGTGKTTTLLTIAAAIRPLAGSVSVLGTPVRAGRPELLARRGVALVPDDRGIFHGLTGHENLRLTGDKNIAQKVVKIFPQLDGKLPLRAGLMSGGEQQMLAIGRAISRAPRVLAIDELSLGLAPVVVSQLLPVIREYADQQGAAILIVDQHTELALAHADRAYVLRQGRLVLEGTASEIAQHRDVLEASYLGEGTQKADSIDQP